MVTITDRKVYKVAEEDIKRGNPDSGINLWKIRAQSFEKAGNFREAAIELEVLAGCLMRYGYNEHAANIYDEIEALYKERKLHSNANAIKSKVLDLRGQLASESGIDSLVRFYISHGLDRNALAVLETDGAMDLRETAMKEYRNEKRTLFDKVLNAYDMAAKHFSERRRGLIRNPGAAGSLYWAMGQMAENLGDYKVATNLYGQATKLFKKDKETRPSLWCYQVHAGLVAIEGGDKKRAAQLLIKGLKNLKKQKGPKYASRYAIKINTSLIGKYGSDQEYRYSPVMNTVLKDFFPKVFNPS